MRMVLASLLIEYDWIFGQIECAGAQSVLDVDEYVSQIVACDDDILSLVRALTARVLAHIDLGCLRRCAIKLHRATNSGYRGRIYRRSRLCRSCRLSRSVAGLFGILFLATSCQRQQATQSQNADCHCSPT